MAAAAVEAAAPPAAGKGTGADGDAAAMALRPVRWAYPICVGLPLIVLNCGWIAHSEMKTGVTEITITTLFMGVTFVLFLVTLLNLAVRRLLGARAAMNQPELMVLFAMLSMSSVVAGIGNLGFFTPFLTNAFRYASPGNRWEEFWHLLPAHIGPRDPAILKGFYEGRSTFFQADVVAAWAAPLLVWGAFFLVLIATMLCLGSIVLRRWADDEHLPFPVVTLPLEMTREGAPLYRQRLLWIGFAVPCALHSLNTLHGLYPSVPGFPVNTARDLVDTLSAPWTGLGSVTYLLHFCGVGFGYLVNTDVLFSLWFFYLLKKGLNLLGTMLGWRDPGPNLYGDGSAQFPYWGFQAWGAWLAVSVAVLWAARGYLRRYVQRAGERGTRLPADEPLRPSLALGGFLLGFTTLCAFVWWSGGSLWLPIAFFAVYFLIMLALSRLVAETAVLSPLLAWVAPQTILPALAGTSALAFSRIDLAHLAVLTSFNTDYRAAAMPQVMQGMVGLRRAGGDLRPLAAVLLLATGVAIVSAFLWDLQMYYTHGAATANVNAYRINMGKVPWNNLNGWLGTPRPADPVAMAGMGVGAGVTFVLSYLRTRFVGFPLSPAAYVLNLSWANELFWGDMFVAWVFKFTFLRYGGIRLYTAALPFFLGLILGDFVTGSAWSIVGTVLRLEIFRTFPN